MTSQANVPHIAPHQLRHSCATNLLRAGLPLPIASNLLNHANVHTTMRYMKAGGDELSEWLRARPTRTTTPSRDYVSSPSSGLSWLTSDIDRYAGDI